MQKLNIVMDPLTPGMPEVEEIVDSVYDAARAINIVDQSLSDGYQLLDFLEAAKAAPIVKEIYNDFPTFQQQLMEVAAKTPRLGVQAVREAYKRFVAEEGSSYGKGVKAFWNYVWLITNTLNVAFDAFQEGKEIYDKALLVVAGTDVLASE